MHNQDRCVERILQSVVCLTHKPLKFVLLVIKYHLNWSHQRATIEPVVGQSLCYTHLSVKNNQHLSVTPLMCNYQTLNQWTKAGQWRAHAHKVYI